MTDNKERINKLDEKIKQLQAQKNSLIAREKEKERKARTRKLIEIGAISVSYTHLTLPTKLEV